MSDTNTTDTALSTHWTGSLALRLFLLSAILIIPLAWLGAVQYDQIHRSIALTDGEERGLEFTRAGSRSYTRRSGAAEFGPRGTCEGPHGYRSVEGAAAAMPDVPTASKDAEQLAVARDRAAERRDPALLGAFGNQLLDAINDIADASRFTSNRRSPWAISPMPSTIRIRISSNGSAPRIGLPSMGSRESPRRSKRAS